MVKITQNSMSAIHNEVDLLQIMYDSEVPYFLQGSELSFLVDGELITFEVHNVC